MSKITSRTLVSLEVALKCFDRAVKKLKKHPKDITLNDIVEIGGLSDWNLRHFGGIAKLKEEYIKVYRGAHPFEAFTKEGLGDIVKQFNVKRGKFFITAASPITNLHLSNAQVKKAELGFNVVGSNVHKEGLSAIKNFCKREKAELIILPLRAHVKALDSQPQHYDPELQPLIKSFATEYIFNRHIKAIEVHLNPQQLSPLTGLDRLKGNKSGLGKEIGSNKMSLIIAHSKQDMKPYATGNSGLPRIIHATGCITKPQYLRNRVGVMAEETHVLGGLVLEIDGDKFYVRQVQLDSKTGSFVDLGVRYNSNGSVSSERAAAVKMGDLHPGYEDPAVLEAFSKLFKVIKPKNLFIEDFFDGSSITHHMEGKNISKARRPKHFATLQAEIDMAKGVLEQVFKMVPKDCKIYATFSNHPEMVSRWLNEGRYIKDPNNFELAHRMVVMKLDKKNPLQEYLDPKRRMIWLGPNDDVCIEGCQMGSHGHLGVNGSKGSSALEKVHGKGMMAHTHTPEIINSFMVVGHSTVHRHGYNVGPSTWIQGLGTVYPGGHMQLINVIDGKMCLDIE